MNKLILKLDRLTPEYLDILNKGAPEICKYIHFKKEGVPACIFGSWGPVAWWKYLDKPGMGKSW